MQRRSVLAAAGAVLVAGCTGTGGGDGGSSGTTTTSTTESDDETTTAGGDETTTTTVGSGSVKGSFEVGKAACGSTDGGRASISFGESSVSVSGVVVGNNGCFSARLSDVVYESAGGACLVVVEAFDASDDDEACTQCITNIAYSATVSFDGELPGTVEVVHDDMGGSSTVATASR